MNYGFNRDVPGYIPERARKLKTAIEPLVAEYNRATGSRAEVTYPDPIYGGVRIRRLETGPVATPQAEDALITGADAAFARIMGTPPTDGDYDDTTSDAAPVGEHQT